MFGGERRRFFCWTFGRSFGRKMSWFVGRVTGGILRRKFCGLFRWKTRWFLSGERCRLLSRLRCWFLRGFMGRLFARLLRWIVCAAHEEHLVPHCLSVLLEERPDLVHQLLHGLHLALAAATGSGEAIAVHGRITPCNVALHGQPGNASRLPAQARR